MNSSPLLERIAALFSEKLHVDPPRPEADLVEEGLLDSLMFVELVFSLEKAFDIHIPLDRLEISDLSSVTKIAAFVEAAVRTKSEQGGTS